MIDTATLREEVEGWLAQDPDAETHAELSSLRAAGDWEALAERFSGRLQFGTAGLRAELGGGPMRMNRLVVRQAAAGLVAYVAERAPRGRRPLLVVGYDARRRSDVFAADTAAVAAARGVEVRVLEGPLPTPVLAFAVRHLGADAGVMVTASHNPPRDNGYKVYLGDGAQIVPPHDERIAAEIARAGRAPVEVLDDPWSSPLVATVGGELVDAYLEAIVAQSVRPRARAVAVAFTALHGVGAETMLAAFRRAGFAPPVVVEDQSRPDPAFPGLPFPNPEEPGVLDRLLDVAEGAGAQVALANDPDADRLGVAVPGPGGWRVLTGDEVGALLADHLLRHTSGDDRLVVSTVACSRLVERMSEAAGVRAARTLTGFKWIVRPALEHPEWRFLFGYEEALGYCVGPVVRDKDGISAALLVAEVVADLAGAGSSPAERLAELAGEHGLHATAQWSVRFGDRASGMAGTSALMARLRVDPPGALAGVAVDRVCDLAKGLDGLAPSDVLVWELGDGSRLVVRPSGTEPKLKVYAEVVRLVPPEAAGGHEEAEREARARLGELRDALRPLLATGGGRL
ncbi:MAG: phospho-sugar mutase [Acidimicrobiia bacterium]|nr:phospho-sugar mutase [Acidimicrobiia bacterium]